MIFLLADPTTTAASLAVTASLLGRQASAVYRSAIIIISFVIGITVNSLYAWLGLDIRHWIAHTSHEESRIIALVSAIALVLKSYLPVRKTAAY